MANSFYACFVFVFTSIGFCIQSYGFYSDTAIEAQVEFQAMHLMNGYQPTEADAIWELRQAAYFMARSNTNSLEPSLLKERITRV